MPGARDTEMVLVLREITIHRMKQTLSKESLNSFVRLITTVIRGSGGQGALRVYDVGRGS